MDSGAGGTGRGAIQTGMIEAIAALHAVPYRAVGLEGFGLPDRFV
ncbi:hypothetical protein ACMV_P1_02570 (plasmid) [Acidiphilium multivorum AIU301]|uniref:Uncharacterized protein n=1 Tax=Acidiphilium multivorum (strain DSM 11245 / JCM 8867 / NBRC 100883 / AIU 301) TaxID=926570 RepID=F0J7I6_ACIMA